MGIGKYYEQYAIPADSFARAVAFAISQPGTWTSTRSSSDRRGRSSERKGKTKTHSGDDGADMNLFTAIFTTMALLASTSTEAQTMVITQAGSRLVRPAPTEHFTGGVRVEMLFEAADLGK